LPGTGIGDLDHALVGASSVGGDRRAAPTCYARCRRHAASCAPGKGWRIPRPLWQGHLRCDCISSRSHLRSRTQRQEECLSPALVETNAMQRTICAAVEILSRRWSRRPTRSSRRLRRCWRTDESAAFTDFFAQMNAPTTRARPYTRSGTAVRRCRGERGRGRDSACNERARPFGFRGSFAPHPDGPKRIALPRTKRLRKWYEELRRKMATKDRVDPSFAMIQIHKHWSFLRDRAGDSPVMTALSRRKLRLPVTRLNEESFGCLLRESFGCLLRDSTGTKLNLKSHLREVRCISPENSLCEKDSPQLILNDPDFPVEVVWKCGTIKFRISFSWRYQSGTANS
jgi:hypothetical protein